MSIQTLTLETQSLYKTAISNTNPPIAYLSPPQIPSDFPLSKLIPNTRFIVDGFRFSGQYSVAYFLSHFHSDHYTGINSSWCKGIIFCSEITGKLLIEVLKVNPLFVFPLQVLKPVSIDGCEVALVDANHCPGAVQFLFKVPVNGGKVERYVHTGDFRYSDEMKLFPILSEFVGCEAVFLDTTYCNPKFVFPSQQESIDHIVSVINRIKGENKGSVKSVLFLVATYVIGKERILQEIAKRCGRKICVDSRKLSILGVLGLTKDEIFTEEESESDIHVVGWNILGETWPYFRPNFVKMREIMNEKGYSKVVGFVPTGWTYEVKRNKFAVRTKDMFEIHLVPYSEHSNYDELREYIRFLKPKRVMPTVGLDVEKLDSKHANSMRKHFAGLVDEMANKQEFLMGFHLSKVDQSHDPKSNNDFDKSKALELLTDNEKEEIVQQFRDCLPSWVTRDQMLELINISGGNFVEAVSHFFEHETEFHEQFKTDFSSCTSQSEINDESALLAKPCSLSSPQKQTNFPLTQTFKSLGSKNSPKSTISPGKNKKKGENKPKSTISPGKNKRKDENKPNKRAKSNLTSKFSDPKQSIITSFFTKKLAPNESQCAGDENLLEESEKDRDCASSDSVNFYKEKVDQFIQIVNGSESLRSYAESLLEETKGDINLAVDKYYASPEGGFCEDKRSVVCCERPAQAENSTCNISSQKGKMAPEVSGEIATLHVQPLLPENKSKTLLSLPLEKYSPIKHACWKSGQPAPYIHLARAFELVEGEKGKIKATSMLCNMFRSLLALSAEDVLPAVYLCTNKIAPDHENKELNIGGSIVVAALEEACGTNKLKLKELHDTLGDLGDVAQLCRQTQSLLAPPQPLSIRGVFSALQKISEQAGSGSTARRKSLIVNLMRSCREKEMKFIVRTLVRNLRIGAMMRTVLPALAQAVVMNTSLHGEKMEKLKEKLQELSSAVVESYNILPNLDLLVPCLLDKGIEFSSTTLSMVPGVPIKPMLAKITNGIPQVLKNFQNKAFTCEYKYDGQRAQIHKLDDGSVRVFSRNGDETTMKFPDLVNTIQEFCCSATATFVVDAEVVAVDRKNGCKLLSFQELSSRERGGKDSLIVIENIKVDICVFIFDIMFANGEKLLNLPLRLRRNYMKDLFRHEKLGYFEYAKEIIVEADDSSVSNESTLMNMKSFLDSAISSSCEGVMVKSLDADAFYAPSKRSDSWLKVKRDYVEGLGDSLDLVPVGAWYGNGRKAGWYSPFLMACYEPDTQEFQSVCRVMSGFSDAFYIEMKEFYSGDKLLSKKPLYYHTGEAPDMWFSPELVWEIKGADFTISPVHKAAVGLVHPSRGISVRFPRFIRSLSDRKPEECSSATDVADMFNSQTRKMDVTTES